MIGKTVSYNYTLSTEPILFTGVRFCGMINAYQAATLFAWYDPILLSFNSAYMSFVNDRITIGTSLCHANRMPCKCKQKQDNTRDGKYFIQYVQPITTKYPNNTKRKRKDIAYPIRPFHTHTSIYQIPVNRC